tara:strand:+ start:2047 stop:2904 length:858 start_codon:yes stop_codon:yes gene_type:complete
MIKKISYFFQAVIIYLFFFIGKSLGLNLSKKIFAFVFNQVGPLFKSKSIIEKNLKNFNINLTDEQKENIISSMWKNYGITFIEYIFLSAFKEKNDLVEVTRSDILKKISCNRPVIFVSGHFSNFELMSMEITKRKVKLATIYRPLNNFFLNPLMEHIRKKYVCKNQIKKGISGVKKSIEYIKAGYSIALMIDQRVSEGERLNFFNQPALTTTLPAQLALKFGLPIIPVFIERKKNGTYKIEFYDEIISANFKNKIDLTQKLNVILEKMIKKNPNEWIWTHNRWKL